MARGRAGRVHAQGGCARACAAAHAGQAGGGAPLSAPWAQGWTGISPSSLHGGQLRRARARRAAAQLQGSCPPSAGQEPSPPLEQKAPAV